MPVQVQSFALNGGLNLADEQVKLKPGEMTDCLNVEVGIAGGVLRVSGYERTDGRAEKPSLATYRLMTFSNGGPRPIQYGDVITGATSGATATVCGDGQLTSGAWADTDALGVVGITLKTGTFVVGEYVLIGGIYAFVITATDETAAIDDSGRNDYLRGAANAQRALINIVPGSGPVRAAFALKGALYAIRDNAAATAGVIYQATGGGGWAAQQMLPMLPFILGGVLITEGMTVNGATSGATGFVQRVAFTGGAWASTTATGYLVLSGITGAFVSGENIRVGVGPAMAVTSAVTSVPTLAPGGTYEVVKWNFYGSYDTERAYIVNGVGPAFEFSEDVYAPISTGMPTDIPEHIAIHKNYVFLSFKGSVQNSGANEPHAYTARLGSNEIGAGDYVTALYSIRQDVLAIMTVNTTQLLYGSSGVDWQLKKMSSVMGCFSGCITDVPGSTVILDTNGVQAINATLNFGDFEGTSLSRKVNPLLRAITVAPIGVVVNRIKSQIRLFYADGSGLFATYSGDRIIGWSKVSFPATFAYVWNGEDADGKEVTLAGGNDGYVYQLDSGNSFDGEMIPALIRLAFYHYNSPERKKRWHKLAAEMASRDIVPMQYATEYDYSNDDQYLSFTPPFDSASGGFYDRGYVYGEFNYDGGVLTKLNGDIDGVSANLGILLYCEDDVTAPWQVDALHVHYTPLGLIR